jgi:hypothetical protein
VLTSFLFAEGSAESKDSDRRLETKVDGMMSRLDGLRMAKPASALSRHLRQQKD